MNEDRLKFRYWHNYEKKYIQMKCDCLAFCYNCFISVKYVPTIKGGWKEIIDDSYTSCEITPEQCTGLKDKNGNLIYEGDLLYGMPVVWVKELCGFRVKVNTIHGWDWHYVNEFTNQEIIGNIHEQGGINDNKML